MTAVLRGPATQDFARKDCRKKGGIISVHDVLKNDQIVNKLLNMPEKEIWADVTAYFENDHYYWGNDNAIQGLFVDWRSLTLSLFIIIKKYVW